MIEIYVISQEYTRNALKKLFIKETRNNSEIDFNEFLVAMIKTEQLIQKGDAFIPTTRVEIREPKRLYLEIKPERVQHKKTISDGVKADEDKITVFNWVGPRINIRAGRKWIEKYGTPEKITLYKIIKDGKEILIPEHERPEITTTKSARYPKTIEAYRSEIPAEIVRKYGLTGAETVKVRIDRIVREFYTFLQLYGYEIDVMTFFGETKKAKRDTRHIDGKRDMELHGIKFPYETKGDISDEIRRRGTKALNVTQAWLEKYDAGYSLLFNDSMRKDVTPPSEGVGVVPLVEKPDTATKFALRDMAKDKTILEALGKLPENWYDVGLDEALMDIKITTDKRTASRKFGGTPSYQATLKSGFKRSTTTV